MSAPAPIPHDSPRRADESVEALVLQATKRFRNRHGVEPRLASAAPGRVNLIGEHTDYNDGFVLPIAIDRWAVVVGDAPRRLPRSIVHSMDLDEEFEIDLAGRLSPVDLDWANYPLGVAAQFRKLGHHLPNVRLVVASSVPIGGGLSSSAALNMALAGLFEQVVGVDLDPREKARRCRTAEHEFAGVPCGIMDPMIAALARANHALLLDCRTEESSLVAMPGPDEAVLLIADTNVRHRLAAGEYAARRRECERAVKTLQPRFPEIRSLRDAMESHLDQLAGSIAPVILKRARHVVRENDRVLRAAEALRAGDLPGMGRLMFASHDSLRDDYEVSCPELDALVELAGELSAQRGGRDGGVFGSRMTGGGFGGCTVTLCRPDAVDTLTQNLTAGYRARFDREPVIFQTSAVRGAHRPDLRSMTLA